MGDKETLIFWPLSHSIIVAYIPGEFPSRSGAFFLIPSSAEIVYSNINISFPPILSPTDTPNHHYPELSVTGKEGIPAVSLG